MNCQDAPQVTQLTSTTVCSRHSKCGWDVADPQTEVYTGATAPGPSHCFCLDSIFDSQPLEACLITGLGHCWAGNNCCDSQCSDQNPDNVDTRCAIGHCTPAFQVADHLFPGNRHPSHNSAYLLDWFGKVPRRQSEELAGAFTMPAWNVTANRLRTQLAHNKEPLVYCLVK